MKQSDPHTLPKRDYTPGAYGPLQGLKVIDLSRLVAGNTLTQQLADFGADVIKVEPREGDTLRHWRVKGIETAWKVLGRGKRSLCIEFRHPEAIELIKKLAKNAAVFVESFKPGTLESMGLGPDVLHQIAPQLVIVRISGWGQDGPYSHRPGFGTLVEGFSGFAEMNGFADREPVLPPLALADTIAGLTGAFSVMAAIREVEIMGGKGQTIDLPLLDPMFNSLGPQAANFRLTKIVKPRTGSRSTGAAPRNVYKTRDGAWVALSASTQAMAHRVMRSIGHPEFCTDPRFETNEARLRNWEALDREIAIFIGKMDLIETVSYFENEDVTIGPVYDIERFMQDEHVRARALVADYPDPDMGMFPMHAISARLGETPGAIRTPAPRLGQHNVEILSELRLDATTIQAAKDKGLIQNG